MAANANKNFTQLQPKRVCNRTCAMLISFALGDDKSDASEEHNVQFPV